ncbi:MAG: glutathione S-transferase C-terminal domain-containing protein, partial [Steroidobacteraceae bacterium]|nr:glutathione S-transferase C-terminal domain-containing protein [Steroidobacteraceae bacterium]
NGSLMPSLLAGFVACELGHTQSGVLASMEERTARAYRMIEERLGAVPYFSGAQFTAADIMMFFPLTTMRVFLPRDLTPYPNLRGYLHRVGGRPAYLRAMHRAEPGFRPLLD